MTETRFYAQTIAQYHSHQMRLQSKRMPLISVDQNENTIKYMRPGQQHQISAAKTYQPIQLHTTAAYFQAKVVNCRSKTEISVGFINKDCALKKHPGQSKYSVGYMSNGQIYFHRSKVGNVTSFKKNDTVGVGVNYSLKELFFTHNGQLLKTKVTGIDSINWTQFYPCVGLRYQGQQVRLFFKEKDFLFNFRQYRMQTELKTFKQISQENCNLDDVYGMVSQYLLFNGYAQTYSLFQKSRGQQAPKIQFSPHPFVEKKITLKNRLQSESYIDEQENQKQDGSDDQFNENNKRSAQRHRIMSDYWGYMAPGELPRKYTIQEERLVMESRRKNSYISNQESMAKELGQEPEQGRPNEVLNEAVQRFMNKTRINIIKLIKQQNIEEAVTIMNEAIPKIFTIYTDLQIFFKMHIFLRKIKRESSKEAISYARSINDQFLRSKSLLFPRFSRKQGRLVHVSFQEMMGSLRFQRDPTHESLSDQQFQCFAIYINELIMRCLGFYSESRLSIMINHLKSMEHRSKQHQITGPIFQFPV